MEALVRNQEWPCGRPCFRPSAPTTGQADGAHQTLHPRVRFTSSRMTQQAIDTAHLARQTGGDHELERELLTLFVQQCAAHLRTIHGSADRQARLDAAHTLKGAA